MAGVEQGSPLITESTSRNMVMSMPANTYHGRRASSLSRQNDGNGQVAWVRDAEKDGVVGSYGRVAIAPGSRITASRAETDEARDDVRSSIANSKAQMLESL